MDAAWTRSGFGAIGYPAEVLAFLLACRDPATAPATATAPTAGAALPVVINEVATSAARSGGGQDWLELYAASDEEVDLAGFTLAIGDGPAAELTGTLPARGFLVLSGAALDGDGDEVALTAPDGATSRVSLGDTWTDVVWARAADGCAGDCWEPTWLGTPGASNGLQAVRTPDLDWSSPTDAAAYFEADPTRVVALDLTVTATDGVVVFVDGEEVLRDHLPGGALTRDTPPLGERGATTTVVRVTPPLLPGTTHVLAVRLHPLATPRPLALSLGVRGPTSAPSDPPPGGVETVPDLPPGGDGVYDATRIHRVALELGPDAIAALDVDTDTTVPAVVTFDGMRVADVTVRRRGKGGSRRPMSGKPKLRVDFTPDGGGGPFRGQGALLLDNLVQDCSGIKTPLAFEVFRQAGNPAPRVGYARLTIDGEDKGLYALTEEVDDRFAEAWWGDPDAVVHDGSYPNQPGEALQLADFRWDRLSWFDQEEGPPNTVLEDVTTALDEWELGARTWADLDDVLDRGSWLGHFAAEQWVGHVDGYVLMPNNEWLVTPADGRTRVVAWDTDQAFLRDHEWFIGSRWTAPGGRIAQLCRWDPACDAEWEATLDALEARVAGPELSALVATVDGLTLHDLTNDPCRECAVESVVPSRDHVRAWLAGRTAELEAGGG